MGLYSQLVPTLSQIEHLMFVAFCNRLAAEEQVCSFYKLFPVRSSSFSRAGCGVRSEFYVCRTRDEVAAAGVGLTRRFLDASRREIAAVIRSAPYKQKLARWPTLAKVTCPAKGNDIQSFPNLPFLPNGPEAVAVDAQGIAGVFEMQHAYSSRQVFFTSPEAGTDDVVVHMAYDFRVVTVA